MEAIFRLGVFSFLIFSVSFLVLMSKLKKQHELKIAEINHVFCNVLFVMLNLGWVNMFPRICFKNFYKYRVWIMIIFIFDMIINMVATSLITGLTSITVCMIWVLAYLVLLFVSHKDEEEEDMLNAAWVKLIFHMSRFSFLSFIATSSILTTKFKENYEIKLNKENIYVPKYMCYLTSWFLCSFIWCLQNMWVTFHFKYCSYWLPKLNHKNLYRSININEIKFVKN